MAIINLTPHNVVYEGKDGVMTFPPSGNVARVSSIETPAEGIVFSGGFEVACVSVNYGKTEGLPLHRDDTNRYIVSSIVKAANPSRLDLIVPNTGKSCIRDANGNIVAVKSFIK